jgi:hypothetical protein
MHYDELKKKIIQLNLNKPITIGSFNVLNTPKFIDSHISTLDSHRGNANFSAFYHRLLEAYNQLK